MEVKTFWNEAQGPPSLSKILEINPPLAFKTIDFRPYFATNFDPLVPLPKEKGTCVMKTDCGADAELREGDPGRACGG